MARCLLIMSVILLGSPLGSAQSVPIAEVFGGYSHVWQSKEHIPGWNASGAINANRWFGILADFSGHYYPETGFANFLRSETSQSDSYRILFGPQFSFRAVRKITPRFHALLGVVHTRTRASGIIISGFPESSERD